MEIHSIISNTFESNTNVVVEGDHAIIIDCGASFYKIAPYLENKKVSIFITHAHFDHIYHLKEYYEKLHCDIYLSSNAYDKLLDSKKNLSYYFINESITVNNIKKENLHFVDEELVHIGEININSFVTTGHSNCSRTYKIDNYLFVGDVLFENGVGRTDLYDGNEEKLKQSIHKISLLSPIAVYSGHGQNFAI